MTVRVPDGLTSHLPRDASGSARRAFACACSPATSRAASPRCRTPRDRTGERGAAAGLAGAASRPPPPPARRTARRAAPSCGRRVVPPDCDGDGTPDATDGDDDNDLLTDALEAAIGTAPCKPDTDGDGAFGRLRVPVGDRSQQRRRQPALPGQAPVPQPAVRRRGHRLRRRRPQRRPGARAVALRRPELAAAVLQRRAQAHHRPRRRRRPRRRQRRARQLGRVQRRDGVGVVGRRSRRRSRTPRATPARARSTPTATATASRDGADDQDFDGWANVDELGRDIYRVQPFNPCLPDYTSRTCSKHPPIEGSYPPFDVPGPLPPAPF